MGTIKKELYLVFFTGILPGVISYASGGIKGLESFVKGSVVTNALFLYFFAFFVAHLILAITYKFYGGTIEKEKRIKMRNFFRFIGVIGSGTMSIYRLVTGLLITIPIFWKISDPSSLSNLNLTLMLVVGISFFGGICYLSSAERFANQQL